MTDIKDLTNPDTLVDINDISLNKDLPKPERIKEYIRQIKNPYRFYHIIFCGVRRSVIKYITEKELNTR